MGCFSGDEMFGGGGWFGPALTLGSMLMGGDDSSAPAINYPQIPQSIMDSIWSRYPSLYENKYSPPASIYSQLEPIIARSMTPRTIPQLNLPTATTPTAGQDLYSSILGGNLALALPGMSGVGKQASDLLAARLAGGGGIDPTLLARSKESIAADIARARELGQTSAMETLQARGMLGKGTSPGLAFSDLERDLQAGQRNALLDLEKWQTSETEDARQNDIREALGLSEYERTLQNLIDQQNLGNRIGIAGTMRGEESNVQNINQERQIGEDQFQRSANLQEQERVVSNAMSLYEYFNNQSTADQTRIANTMLDTVAQYLGTGRSNAQGQLESWINSERFAQADDSTFLALMTQLGQSLIKQPRSSYTPVAYYGVNRSGSNNFRLGDYRLTSDMLNAGNG